MELESAALPALVEAAAFAGAPEDATGGAASAGALEDMAGGTASAGALDDATGGVTSAGAPEGGVDGVEMGDELPFAIVLPLSMLAVLEDDSLTEAFESSVEALPGEDLVEAELRTGLVLATCFGGAFALGATVSCD